MSSCSLHPILGDTHRPLHLPHPVLRRGFSSGVAGAPQHRPRQVKDPLPSLQHPTAGSTCSLCLRTPWCHCGAWEPTSTSPRETRPPAPHSSPGVTPLHCCRAPGPPEPAASGAKPAAAPAPHRACGTAPTTRPPASPPHSSDASARPRRQPAEEEVPKGTKRQDKSRQQAERYRKRQRQLTQPEGKDRNMFLFSELLYVAAYGWFLFSALCFLHFSKVLRTLFLSENELNDEMH